MRWSILECTTNKVTLRGMLSGLPQRSHENHGRVFYTFQLEVERLSGATDLLDVIAPADVLEQMDLSGGQMIEVTGQLRSFNNRQSTGRRLVISVFAESLQTCDGEPDNLFSWKAPSARNRSTGRTPLGREICDVMLAREPAVSPRGLSALHFLGKDRTDHGRIAGGNPSVCDGTAAEPGICENAGKRQ